MDFLTVDLYNDFQCIGSACPDTCCAGWGIIIDEETYGKMEEHEKELGLSANDWILQKDNCKVVKMDHMRCPMLDEDNLCKVVGRLGPEYLSRTCAVYPRLQVQYGNVIEGHLTFSCPEVVVRLMDKTELQFDFMKEGLQEAAEPYPQEKLYLYEAAVRTDMVESLQYLADISLCTRVVLAFDILERAIQFYKNGYTDSESFKQNITGCFQNDQIYRLDAGLSGMVEEVSRYQFLSGLLCLVDEQNNSERFREMLQQTKEYFTRNNLAKYLDDLKIFKDIMRRYEGFHVRYWVYRIFSDLIAIPDFEKAKENFLCIAAGFCLAQIMALAVCAEKHKLERETYICIISNISRKLEHNNTFRERFIQRLEENNVNGLAGLLLLII